MSLLPPRCAAHAIRIQAFASVVLVFAFLLHTSLSAQTFSQQLNPTGDPIGGYVGYSDILTEANATVIVRSASELVSALQSAGSGDVVFIPSDAVIDMGTRTSVAIPAGVTLASDRGKSLGGGAYSDGGLITSDYIFSSGVTTIFVTGGSNVRVTGLRAKGPFAWAGDHEYGRFGYSGFITANHTRLEVDNTELWAWNKWAVWAKIQGGVHVHHNFIHHTRRDGYGYGVWFGGSGSETGGVAIAEANLFEANRHHVASSGHPNSWEIRYNVVLPRGSMQQNIDRHGYVGSTGGIDSHLHHNLFLDGGNDHFDLSYPLDGYGGETRIHNNWFKQSNLCSAGGIGDSYNGCNVNHPRVFIYDNTLGGAGTTLPNASISSSVNGGPAPLTVTFNGAGSSDPDGHSLSWARWHFGDGDVYGDAQVVTDVAQPVTHTFTEPGRYDVELIVFNEFGVPGTQRKTITVEPASGGYVLSAWVNDTYSGSRTGYYEKQLRINDQVVWSDDVAGEEGWQHVVVNLPGSLSEGSSVKVGVRLFVNKGVTDPANEIIEIRTFFDDIHVFGGSLQNASFESSGGWGFSGTNGGTQSGFSVREARSGARSARLGYSYAKTSTTGASGEYHQTVVLGEVETTTDVTQDIVLAPGWNLVSANVAPSDASIASILAPLGDNFVIAKSQDGDVYSPEFGINTIGTWQSGEAYLVYVSQSDVLPVTGTQIPVSTPIALGTGWNLAAFYPEQNQSTTNALSSIISDLVIAKDGSGNLFYPELSVDDIETMVPGQGYQLYMTQSSPLIYSP